jgi:hypothetical protein
MITLGEPIDFSTRFDGTHPGYSWSEFTAALRRCFDAMPELSEIVMLWQPPATDHNGNNYGQWCELAYHGANGEPVTAKTPYAGDTFKAAAWDLHDRFGRVIGEFGTMSEGDPPSSWRVRRELDVWAFEDEDLPVDPEEFIASYEAQCAAPLIHQVLPCAASGHDMLNSIEALQQSFPKIHDLLFNGRSDDHGE